MSKPPDLIKYKPAARNEGQLEINRGAERKPIPLTMNGKRLIGNELIAGELYEIDVLSGEIRPVKRR